MLKFLFKGLLRDRSRSLLPVIVVTLGVMITVFMQAYMDGVLGEGIEKTASFSSGHICVETKAFANHQSQMPNDLALIGVDSLKRTLQHDYPELEWTERIDFAGLLDAPDENGQTRSQGNVLGKGIHLIDSDEEINRMQLKSLLVNGRFPQKAGEILLSNELFKKMKLRLDDKVTLISTTMFGEMAMYNFRVVGTLHFGVNMLDKGMMIADIGDVQEALNMDNAAGQILGFFKTNVYNDKKVRKIVTDFNRAFKNTTDEFAPVMTALSDEGLMGMSYSVINNISKLIILIFIIAMSIVLWNAGLISGLRRYGEFGLRLAIGENKTEVYRSLIWEAMLIGIVGSVIGTLLGLFVAWLLQTYGLDMSGIMKDSNMMISNVLHAKITPQTYYVGFIPGLFATIIGALLAGIGIYKRQTANLFKELEN